MNRSFQRLGILLLAVAAAACSATSKQNAAAPAAKSALDKAVLETYIRHLFVWGSQIQVKIGDPKPSDLPGFLEVIAYASANGAHAERKLYVSRDGQKVLQGVVYDIQQNPFKRQLDKLDTASSPGLGAAGAPVVVVEFSDFECPFCKEEAKSLRQNLTETYPTQVRLYFKDFPLEPIHPWAKSAAIAGRCVFQQNEQAFWQYHDWIFDHQGEITKDNLKSKVLEFAQGKQLDALRLDRCLDTRATEAEVDKSIAEGKSLEIGSTPTIFVNGRMLVGKLPWPQLKGIIDYELQYQKTAHDAGEQSGCEKQDTGCEVKLPSPLAN